MSVFGALDRARVDLFVERLLTGGNDLPFISHALAFAHHDLAEILPTLAGALIVPVGQDGDHPAWF